MVRVITNLVKNAFQSISINKKPIIDITLSDEQNEIILKVKDNGVGISNEIKHKIFEPKFTTKNSGMGLGLAMVKKIIQDYNGSIHFTTDINGSCFIVKLPK